MAITKNMWSVGENTPGYLPDNDPSEYDTWEEAREAVREAATEWNNENAEHSEECEAGLSADCDHCGNEGLIGSVLSEVREGEAIDVRLDIAGVDIRVFFAYTINLPAEGPELPPEELCSHGMSAWLCGGPEHYPAHL